MAKLDILWSCPQCDEQTRFRGLCRECTVYDADGNPTKPVHRVRLNHNPSEGSNNRVKTKIDFVNSRRKHPSKKQLGQIQEMLNSQSRNVSDEEDDFRPIGQAITDEIIGGEEE